MCMQQGGRRKGAYLSVEEDDEGPIVLLELPPGSLQCAQRREHAVEARVERQAGAGAGRRLGLVVGRRGVQQVTKHCGDTGGRED